MDDEPATDNAVAETPEPEPTPTTAVDVPQEPAEEPSEQVSSREEEQDEEAPAESPQPDRKAVAQPVTIAPLAAGDAILTGPGDMTVDATSPGGREVNFTVTGSGGWIDELVDGDGGGMCLSHPDPLPFPPTEVWDGPGTELVAYAMEPTLQGSGTFPIGTRHVLCFMSSLAMESSPDDWAVHRFSVTVVDPGVTVTVPDDITAEATSAAGTSVAFAVSAADAFDGPLGYDCLLPSDRRITSGEVFPIGTTRVTCYSDLNSRNKSASASFEITVQDTTAPTLTIPGTVVDPANGKPGFALVATGANGAVLTYATIPHDLVDPDPQVVCGIASGAMVSIGQTTFSCHARDSAGNDSEQIELSVRVRAPIPVLTVPQMAVGEGTSPQGGPVHFEATAVNFLGEPLEVICYDASGAHPWPLVESGDVFRWGTSMVNCRTEDAWGGDTSEDFIVTVQDTTGPVITVPDNMRVVATSRKGAAVDFEVTAHDARHGERPVTCSPASGSTFALGTTTVTCTASEPEILNRTAASAFRAPGLSTSASFTVTVVKAAQEPGEPRDDPKGDKGSKNAGDTEDADPVLGLGNTGASMTMLPGLLGLLLMLAGVVLLRRRRA